MDCAGKARFGLAVDYAGKARFRARFGLAAGCTGKTRFGLAADCTGKARSRARFGLAVGALGHKVRARVGLGNSQRGNINLIGHGVLYA